MIVDAHVHLLPDAVRANLDAVASGDPWFAACHAGAPRVASPASLLADMDATGVDHAVCFTWPFIEPSVCAEANDWLARVVGQHSDRLTGFGVVNPADPAAGAEAERCARLGLRGLGELNADAQNWSLGEGVPGVDALAALSVRLGLAWNLHCSEPVGHAYPGKGTATPGLIAGFAERHPELQLICAHLGGGLPLYAQMPEVRRLCRRLWFDTAAQPYLYEPAVYRTLVDLVGADRLLYGSDHPLLSRGSYQTALDAAGLSREQKEAILGGNAARLLAL
ncbi:MAG: hypothetical protein NVSMB29_10500 [Candidatus Dormibacteria bacterium]